MKKLLLSAFVLLIFSAVKAQIPDYNFECWDTIPGSPGYVEPCNWCSYNPSSQFGYPIFVYKTTDSQTGNYAVEVRTMGYTNPFPPYQHLVDIGVARTGDDYQNGVTGFRDTVRHSMFSVWVKYSPVGGPDSAEIKIKLYKWNVNQGHPDDVAEAKFYVSSNDASYHCVQKAFTYFSPFTLSGNPDTACVYISATQGLTEGNIIKVDNIVYGNCLTGIEEANQSSHLSIYPNPASDVIYFSAFPKEADRIKVFETTGRMVLAEAASSTDMSVDVKKLSSGIYFYGVYDDNNKIISSGKFSIVR